MEKMRIRMRFRSPLGCGERKDGPRSSGGPTGSDFWPRAAPRLSKPQSQRLGKLLELDRRSAAVDQSRRCLPSVHQAAQYLATE